MKNSQLTYTEQEYSFGFASQIGRGRQVNEDEYTLFTIRELSPAGEAAIQMIVVADGSSGGNDRGNSSRGDGSRGNSREIGKVASHLAVQTFYQSVTSNEYLPLRARMIKAIEEANAVIHQQALADSHLSEMRATLITAAISGGMLYFARVGDSQAYLIRNGYAYCLTPDHYQPSSHALANRTSSTYDHVINDWQISSHLLGAQPTVSVVTTIVDIEQARFMGNQVTTPVETQGVRFSPNDVVLLCSRSLTNYVSEPQLAVTASQLPTQEAATQLAGLALQAGASDDVTIVMAQRLFTAIPTDFTKPTRSLVAIGLVLIAFLVVLTTGWFVISNRAIRSAGLGGGSGVTTTNTSGSTQTPQAVAEASETTNKTAITSTESASESSPKSSPESNTEPTRSEASGTTVQATPLETAPIATPTQTPLPTSTQEATATPITTNTLTPVATVPAQAAQETQPTETPTSIATATALPTQTPLPTSTLLPTHTVLPTNTPLPTNTALPTDTATVLPSKTPVPTNTEITLSTITLSTNPSVSTNTPIATFTPVATNTPVATFTPIATNTAIIVPSNTPLPSNTPRPTSIPIPTKPPKPTAKPAATLIPPPTPPPPTPPPPTPPPPSTNQRFWDGQYVTLVTPIESETLVNWGIFSWTPLGVPLPEGYAYEFVLWKRGEDAMLNGMGWAGSTHETTIKFNFDGLGVQPGEYNWGILLVQTAPTYQRLAQLSPKRLIVLDRR